MADVTLPITADLLTADGDTFEIAEGTTTPPLRVELSDATGAAVDLTDVHQVDVVIGSVDGTLVDARADIVDATAGQVEYEFDDGETDRSGAYRARFELSYFDGRTLAVPTARPVRVYIGNTV